MIAEAAPADDDVVISARGLTKQYGERLAVDDLDLEVRRGEIFGLLGPNGAGKTTTVLMLLGLTEPTAGEVSVAGFDPRKESLQVKRRVGYLPDSVGFYGNMTGRENLRYTARLNGIKRQDAETRITEVLEHVGLADRADDRADAYSRGMRQRLGIADALVKDPEILILDEPTTAIDPIGVIEILELIKRLARDRGIAILLASHLLDQVQSVCQRVGIFHQGQVIGQGTVDELAAEFGQTTDRLEVAVEGDATTSAPILALMLGVPGVASAEPLEELPGRVGWHLVTDGSRNDREVGRDVIDRLLGTNVRLERFGRSRPSLEQIYRQAVERVSPNPGAVETMETVHPDDDAQVPDWREMSATRRPATKIPTEYRPVRGGRKGGKRPSVRPTGTPETSGTPDSPSPWSAPAAPSGALPPDQSAPKPNAEDEA
jgi:ABC-2 type transport system ATP-binding protein